MVCGLLDFKLVKYLKAKNETLKTGSLSLDEMVRPKKFLGQHFLRDLHIAEKIVDALQSPEQDVLEIGPGMGVLTAFLLKRPGIRLKVVEIDRESVAYLRDHFPSLKDSIIEGDLLDMERDTFFNGRFAVIGNLPYNISSQIFFKVLEWKSQVTEVVGMIQKEVAERIASPPGSKAYGILSVLLQAYFDIELLFRVPPGVFSPPPQVTSAVIRMKRNKVDALPCDEVLFKKIVKQAFQMRRKTLRNALKSLNLPASILSLDLMDKRAEQLRVDDFILLTQLMETSR
jgi:16S rRNA (adenine1518-N6/adenine1519-N6)-dimethyltransferase